MKSKKFFVSAICLALVLITSSAMASDIPPPVYGLNIVGYEDVITQTAGTREIHEVEVKNIGVVEIGNIYLISDRLESGWFESNSSVSLEFDKVGVLKYYMDVPESAEGMHVFSLIAVGDYGVGKVSKIVPVILKVENAKAPATTTTTTQQLPHIEIPGISVPEWIGNVSIDSAFGWMRSVVDSARNIAGSKISDEAFLVYVIAALLAVLGSLFLINNFWISRKR